MAIIVKDGSTRIRTTSQSNSVASVFAQPRPSQIYLCRDHLGSVSAERNSASCRGESTLYISDSILLRFTLTFERLKKKALSNWHRCRGHKSSTDPLYAFDPEIELTLRRLRKIRNAAINTTSSIDSVIDSNQFYTNNFVSSSNIFAEPEQMENNDRTLKELATPDVVYQPWCIQYPQLEPAQTYELKS
ncbi:hypothetical protein CR513_03938, partial [Mucuna pruriens]